MKKAVVLVIILGALYAGYTYVSPPKAKTTQHTEAKGSAIVDVIVPDTLTPIEAIGKVAFNAKCASCHGPNAHGQQDVAPPLIHKIYEPNHHGDLAFERAAILGVKAHHWPFGNMPAIKGITQADIKPIIAYVRRLQRENGIL